VSIKKNTTEGEWFVLLIVLTEFTWLSVIPWWVWFGISMASALTLWLIWYFSPYQRIRRAASQPLNSSYAEFLKALVQNYGTRPLIDIAKALPKNTWYGRHYFWHGLELVRDLINNVVDLRAYSCALEEIALASGEFALFDVFCNGLPLVKDKIKNIDDLKAYGLAFAEIDNTSKANLFNSYLSRKVKDQIKNVNDLKAFRAYALAFMEIFRAGGSWEPNNGTNNVFYNGFREVDDLIEKYGIELFAKIAKISGGNTPLLFQHGLPLVSSFIKSDADVEAYSDAFEEIARACGSYAYIVFFYGLPIVKDQLKNIDVLKAFGQVFAEIVNASEEYTTGAPISWSSYTASLVLSHGLPLVKAKIKNINNLKDYSLAFLNIIKVTGLSQYATGRPVDMVFNAFGSPVVKNLIDRFDIEPFVKLTYATGPSAGHLFQYGLPAMASQIHSKDDLLNKDLLIRGLTIARANLREPYYEVVEDGYSQTSVFQDPDGDTRNWINSAIVALEKANL
jgi:hypothetical protein